ncbi:hypothetical protein IQ266_21975 [filamentous cyanobacterium LEGE 11480]|uniref:Uncharacterized protein n=1 Tax=Romeriopsis navalis LEGE 11480 TaxID=2777977 RepID=A0A928VSW6_9CYAN|nr:hypothetical protein [Romeriopsis navalis]MBE9032411.1 hypothetical protein [Romeriopsis navalis LEGE 11480]
MTTILLVDSYKALPEKYSVACALHHLLRQEPMPLLAIDADSGTPTYHEIYGDARLILLNHQDQQQPIPETLLHKAVASNLLINLPPQIQRSLYGLELESQILNFAHDRGIAVKRLWVSTGEADSLAAFVAVSELYGPAMKHMLVRLNARSEAWKSLPNDLPVQKIGSEPPLPVIDLPYLPPSQKQTIYAQRMTFADALTYQPFGIVGLAIIQRFLNAYQLVLGEADIHQPDRAESAST